MSANPYQPEQHILESDSYLMARFREALKRKSSDMLRQVLVDGLNPNTFELHGYANGVRFTQHIVFEAVSSSSAPCLRVLLEAGADPRLARPEGGDSPLIRAISRERLDMAAMLIDAGDDINALANTGWTPVHAASAAGSLEILELLECRGAKLDVVTNDGVTPLMLIAGNPEATRWLLQKLPHRVNDLSNNSSSALFEAIKSKNLECVNLMLGADADPSLKAGKYNAEEFARSVGYHAIADQIAMVQAAREARALISSLRTSIGARPAA